MRAPRPKSGPVMSFPPKHLGRGRFTLERFFGDCCDGTRKYLTKQWREGNQLFARKVPVDGLPCVVLFAAYAHEYGVEVVDDYDLLLQRTRDNMADFTHNDKFFVSCICILAERGQAPSDEAFESINIPKLYEEIMP